MQLQFGLLIACLAAPLLVSLESPARETLEEQLKAIGAKRLAAEARRLGDAQRGAVVFYQAALACTRCHIPDEAANRLGPDLTAIGKDATDAHLIESILEPSKTIRKGYEPVVLESGDQLITGFLVSADAKTVVVRDAARNYKEVEFKRAALTEYSVGTVSLMPAGLVNLLANKQQFLDLARYLIEIRDGGSARARELEPDPSLYSERPLPEYESKIDHAGFIKGLDRSAFDRGKKIYERLCINCHGTHEEEGSLPTSLKFASQPFKNGSDPHTMYQTLTRGFGMMVAQTWMVPSQKYDVIHYIREAYLEKHNPSQFFAVDQVYLDHLPKGDSRGPAPSNIAEWQQMDYGPNQVMTLEIGKDGKNFAYKGNVIRLDAGPGGIAQGRYWMVFDHDTLRVAAAWTGEECIDWNCIHFNGRHAIHPRLVGDLHVTNPTGPGWGRASDGSFADTRLVGRDGRRYGPLPRDWAQYKGMYYHGPDTIIEYTVGGARVLEMPGVQTSTRTPAFTRTFNIGPREHDLVMQVAHTDAPGATLVTKGHTAWFGMLEARSPTEPEKVRTTDASRFNGGTRLEVANTEGLHAGDGDFTLTARIKTKKDGTIVAQTADQTEWASDGLTWFVRDGRLTIDIGWVGAFQGRRRVANDRWRHVAVTYRQASGEIRFFVDGKPEKRTGHLQRKAPLAKPVVRIGYTASNFPKSTFFQGRMTDVQFYNAALRPDQVAALAANQAIEGDAFAAHWDLTRVKDGRVMSQADPRNDARVIAGRARPTTRQAAGITVAGIEGETQGMRWLASGGNLRLRIPAGRGTRKFTLWFGATADKKSATALAEAVVIDRPARDLTPKTRGGPARWRQVLLSTALIGAEDGPFAIDVLKRPTDNPWFCRLRLTGFDFTPDGDAAIVSTWDGSIWKVSGLDRLPSQTRKDGTRSVPISWRRIASGLFQPLGVKIRDGKIYVICRDQIAILHDLNGDDEIDWFECFNNDHQVTDHFHEFAMGLQADAAGNFYYAKSARHAKTALVPHHGTLLKVSKDGQRTEIIASGFRAANGVCLNPDGSFIVTDQEGHWNPKNRINYVKPGGFYGNMYGYHDVTDTSDSAMEQPLVWITNSFDRSPSELLWVDSPRWGPLNKRLLNFSYGYGKVYIVPHEEVDGQMQGGMCAFPIKNFPTGVMRGRFHPGDGQLYLAGMFAWAGSQHQPGGFYRLRYTGRPVHLPIDLAATKTGITIRFSGKLDAAFAESPANYRVKAWDLKRTKSYGSKHYNERPWKVMSARLADDGQTVHLEIPEIGPTWGMEIQYELQSEQGKPVRGKIHNTIHKLK